MILVVSDLHLGDGGDYEIFAGETALPALVASVEPRGGELIVNGDAFDFLTNDDPLILDPAQAVRRAEAMVAARATLAVLTAMKRFVADGGRLEFRLGNHDVELALPEVQAVLRRALGAPDPAAGAVQFLLGDTPTLRDVAGARILLTHGEYADPMNRIRYTKEGASAALSPKTFRYPPGSRVVKSLLNPLKKRHQMRYMDLLKPDFEGAVLTALATNPAAVRVLWGNAPMHIAWGFLQGLRTPLPFAPGDDRHDLTEALRRAGLAPDELTALERVLRGGEGPLAFDDTREEGALAAARLKLLRVGLEAYAHVHRRLARGSETFFALTPRPAELTEARRLAVKFGARIVLEGHTHAARWHEEAGLVYANTGTWIPLMRLPDPEANDFEWGAYLAELRKNPSLDAARQHLVRVETHFHFVRIDADRRVISLEEMTCGGPRVVGQATLGGAS